MCRLFGQLSAVPADARRLLVDSEFSLLRQSDSAKDNPQKDGWGIASFGTDGRPSVSKSVRAACDDAAAFEAAARARSRAVIGHIRAASNPRGLPRRRLVNLESTQPFTDGRWVFAHNGTLEIPAEVERRLGPLRRRVKSLNDSEVYFWQFMKFLERTKDPALALREAIADIWDAWAACRARRPGVLTPYTSLNAVLSDGRSLHAVCHAVRRGRAKCAIFDPDQPWSVMSFSLRGKRLIAASEPLDRGPWTRLVQPEILSAEIRGGDLKVRRQRFSIDAPIPEAVT